MKPTTLEWIQKAEEDWHVAQMSYRARKYPSYDAAVFHAQQCAEKYLKARLEEAAIGFARTHDLLMLPQLVLPVEPNWQALQTPLAFLKRCKPGTTSRNTARRFGPSSTVACLTARASYRVW
jgi:hypothetical protein